MTETDQTPATQPTGRIDRIRVSIALDLSTLQLADESDRRAIIRICELTAPEGITPEALREAAAKIFIRFRSTRSWDDDCYWCGQSPFNGKWYVFAQDFGRPAFISDQYPTMMDE